MLIAFPEVHRMPALGKWQAMGGVNLSGVSPAGDRAWADAQPFIESAKPCPPGAVLCNPNLRSIHNPDVFREALHALQSVCDVTYYKGRDGQLYSITDLDRGGIENVQGNERYWPRYFDSGNPTDLNCRTGMPQQTAPGASTFTGKTIPLWESQPKTEAQKEAERVAAKLPPTTPAVIVTGTTTAAGGASDEGGFDLLTMVSGLPWYVWAGAAGLAFFAFQSRGRG
jgi:hypothetical protein